MKKISIYKIISVVAFILLVVILVLPTKFNVNKKQKTDDCIRYMKIIYAGIDDYMHERQENFTGTAQDLKRTGYLKASYECPETGVGDKYVMSGNFETGEIIVTCANVLEFPDHVLPASVTE